MRKIIILNEEFDADEITCIEEVEAHKQMFLNREAGFRIYLKNKKPIVFSEHIPYESYPREIKAKKEKWAALRIEAVDAWLKAKITR